MTESIQQKRFVGDPRCRLSVIIVSWNVQDDLHRCLDSLMTGNRGEGIEVWVVDNASSDGTVQMLEKRYPQVRLICNSENRGFAAANNQGLEAADAEYYLLLNPDTIVPEGGLQTLLQFADAHPEAGAIGPQLRNPDGSLQYSARRFPTITAAIFRNTILGRLFPGAASPSRYLMTEWDHGDARQLDWVSGACMMVRGEALEQIGYLDEAFFWGSEDVDFCFRLHRAGWEVWYTPEPRVVHAIGRSTSQVVIPTIIRTHRSMRRLYAKHLARNCFSRAIVSLGISLRCGLLVCSYLTVAGITRVRGLLSGAQRPDASG